MSSNYYYGQDVYNNVGPPILTDLVDPANQCQQYTPNYDPQSAYGYSSTYLPSNSHGYASVPMKHSTSGSSMGSHGSHNSYNSFNSHNSHYTYPSSPDDYYNNQPISPSMTNPLPKIDVYHTDPVNTSTKSTNKSRTSTSGSNPKSGILHCLHDRCEYQTKRQYDLDRHQKTHFPSEPGEKFPCPGRGCGRTGEHGFDRKDHLREHLRKVHAKDIPKQNRRSSKSPGQS